MTDGIIQTKEGFHVLRDDSHLSRWIEAHGRLDVAKDEIMRLFKPYIRTGDTVIDAGASLGDHATTYAELVGPTGRVLAFEPNPLAFECLKWNMLRHPQVFCYNFALGCLEGGVEFERDANAGASHIMGDGKTDSESPLVNVTTLDAMAMEVITRCDFIHLDAEGYEPLILDGAANLIRAFRPVLAIEICHGHLARYGLDEAGLRTRLSALNYRVQELEGNPASEQRDVLALPQ